MKTYAHERHRNPAPWQGAPAWALEIGTALDIVLIQQEAIMAELDDTKAALNAVKDTNGKLIAEIERLISKITGAAPPVATAADLTALTAEANQIVSDGNAELTKSQTAVP